MTMSWISFKPIFQISDPNVAKEKESIYERAKQHLKLKQFSAKTFEEYGLRGTPSAILIDKKGILQQIFFGSINSLENTVKELLNE
jgi:hypothetical protein